MEPNNLPVIAKKFWSIVRAALFMLKQGICKRKLMLDLNLMLKRGKIAGKAAIHGLMFHRGGNHHLSVFAAAAAHRRSSDPPNEYEFSCSNSPAAYRKTKHALHFPCAHAPPTDDDSFMKALEMHALQSETASPALPGFGRTPLARQLRVTDSPFPVGDAEADCHVDDAADEFISRFYKDLRMQRNS
nr:AF211533_1 Avr9/Cf-9 rapidly elicited protein 146 [Ipomoea batatas]